MNKIPSKLEIDESLQACVQHGLMEVVDNVNGEDQYKLTDKGMRYVEAMPDKRKMSTVLGDDEEAQDALDEFFKGNKTRGEPEK